MRFTTQLLPKRSGNLGVLWLNNPKPLHALTIDMVRCCQDVLNEWYKDETMKAFLVRSSEAKVPAFCAGGDVKQVYLAGCAGNDAGPHGQGIAGVATADFFRDEYIMNYLLATSPIPQISIWDGIVMGTFKKRNVPYGAACSSRFAQMFFPTK
jgi:enoyl-CoA hydratase/carnithine racemase